MSEHDMDGPIPEPVGSSPWVVWAEHVGEDETAELRAALAAMQELAPLVHEVCERGRAAMVAVHQAKQALSEQVPDMTDLEDFSMMGRSGAYWLSDLASDLAGAFAAVMGDLHHAVTGYPEWADQYPDGMSLWEAANPRREGVTRIA